MVLVNQRGEVTETTIANLAVRLDGRWWTPPTGSGCLPGVERARLLDLSRLRERVLTPGDLRAAEDLAVLNSLRGWRAARLHTPAAVRGAAAPESRRRLRVAGKARATDDSISTGLAGAGELRP